MKKDNTKLLAYLSLVVVVLTWGMSPVISKFMLNTYSPGIKRLMDALFASAALGAIANKQVKTINKSILKISLFVGACFALGMILEGVALNFTTPAKSSFYGNGTCITVPLFVALFSKKMPSVMKIVAGVVCVAGFGVIIFGDTLKGGLPSFALGDALTLLSGVFYGATSAAINTWGKHINSILLTFLEFCITIPFCAAYVFLFEDVSFSWDIEKLLIIAAAAILVQGVCWLLRNFAVQHLDAGLVAIISSFSTVVAGVVSILAGMDVFKWSLVVGGAICVMSAILSGLSSKPKQQLKTE